MSNKTKPGVHTVQLKPFFNTLLAGVAATLVMVASAQAGLVARDLNGDTLTDAFYDTDRDITWLRDANVNGTMTWAAANAWASGYSIGIHDDWRLPTVVQPDSACSDSFDAGGTIGMQSVGFDCTGSEMGHLWYTELGNTSGSFTKVGGFLNLQSRVYWSGTEYAPNPDSAWGFSSSIGYQGAADKGSQIFAMAVRPGDVLAAQVPEPESLLLALTALSVLALVRRRRAIGSLAL